VHLGNTYYSLRLNRGVVASPPRICGNWPVSPSSSHSAILVSASDIPTAVIARSESDVAIQHPAGGSGWRRCARHDVRGGRRGGAWRHSSECR